MGDLELAEALEEIRIRGWAEHRREVAGEPSLADLAAQCEADGMAAFSAKTNDYARFGYGAHTIPKHA